MSMKSNVKTNQIVLKNSFMDDCTRCKIRIRSIVLVTSQSPIVFVKPSIISNIVENGITLALSSYISISTMVPLVVRTSIYGC
jgi:rRNA-processing protein FCF1